LARAVSGRSPSVEWAFVGEQADSIAIVASGVHGAVPSDVDAEGDASKNRSALVKKVPSQIISRRRGRDQWARRTASGLGSF
jgi:hypothetical protein